MHDYSLEDLSQYFHLPINDVARDLGVCATVLKKICRKNGINRWPHRKIKSVDKMIANLESVQFVSEEEKNKMNAEIDELKYKREYLLKNPNVSFKTLIAKSSLTARPQKFTSSPSTLAKLDITKSTRHNSPSFSNSNGTTNNCRNQLINSQDELAIHTLFSLSKSEPTDTEDSKIFVEFLSILSDKSPSCCSASNQTVFVTPIINV
jgi:hypothetical protein